MKKLFLFVSLIFILLSAIAQPKEPINPALLNHFWKAKWITIPGVSLRDYGVYDFRKDFNLEEKPSVFIVHISADNRYRLFINGNPVCFGPARGDFDNWRYETIDISGWLRTGNNIIAAEVWNFGVYAPEAQITDRTAFILQGNSDIEKIVNTDTSWRVIVNKSYSPEIQGPAKIGQYFVTGPGDIVDGNLYPWGWKDNSINIYTWLKPDEYSNGIPKGTGTGTSWALVPRTIPFMEESQQRIKKVIRCSGIAADEGFINGTNPLQIEPSSKVSIWLDQTFETNAYPELIVKNGKGSKITVTYSEAMFDGKIEKGNRNETIGRDVFGQTDVFIPDGGQNRLFRPLWFRTFRYIKMDIETSSEPLTLIDYYGVFTGYPFKENAYFKSSDESLKNIWNVGWRTARLCAYETYFDCPYYEQLQYIGDTRIQALISMYVSGDDRLVKNAISLFNSSIFSDGLTRSRYPSYSKQVINTFSLIYVNMVHDFWMHREDDEFIKSKLQGISDILNWFEQRINTETGILNKVPYWSFVDWPDQWEWSKIRQIGGEPDGATQGQSSIISLQFALALDDAADLFSAYHLDYQAKKYRGLAKSVKSHVIENCWDVNRKSLASTPAKLEFSQHANVLAVLSDAIPESEQASLINRTINDTNLIQATVYFRFYLLKAMKKAGLGDNYLSMLTPWRKMLDIGLTTFAERPEPTRSDCHAWSASPNYDFMATVLGIEPAEPGFKTVKIEPHPGALTWAEGSMPHPKGEIKVKYTFQGNNGIDAEIILPKGLSGVFYWKGQQKLLNEGKQVIKF